MAYQNFTTWTEVNGGDSTVFDKGVTTSTKCSWVLLGKDEISHVYDSWAGGAGDFTHQFEMWDENLSGKKIRVCHWALSKVVGDAQPWEDGSDADFDFIHFGIRNLDAASTYFEANAGENGGYNSSDDSDGVYNLTNVELDDQDHFITVTRVGDTVTFYIRTGSHSGTLKDTLILDLTGLDSIYSYIYAVNSYKNNQNARKADGYTQNLDLDVGASSSSSSSSSFSSSSSSSSSFSSSSASFSSSSSSSKSTSFSSSSSSSMDSFSSSSSSFSSSSNSFSSSSSSSLSFSSSSSSSSSWSSISIAPTPSGFVMEESFEAPGPTFEEGWSIVGSKYDDLNTDIDLLPNAGTKSLKTWAETGYYETALTHSLDSTNARSFTRIGFNVTSRGTTTGAKLIAALNCNDINFAEARILYDTDCIDDDPITPIIGSNKYKLRTKLYVNGSYETTNTILKLGRWYWWEIFYWRDNIAQDNCKYDKTDVDWGNLGYEWLDYSTAYGPHYEARSNTAGTRISLYKTGYIESGNTYNFTIDAMTNGGSGVQLDFYIYNGDTIIDVATTSLAEAPNWTTYTGSITNTAITGNWAVGFTTEDLFASDDVYFRNFKVESTDDQFLEYKLYGENRKLIAFDNWSGAVSQFNQEEPPGLKDIIIGPQVDSTELDCTIHYDLVAVKNVVWCGSATISWKESFEGIANSGYDELHWNANGSVDASNTEVTPIAGDYVLKTQAGDVPGFENYTERNLLGEEPITYTRFYVYVSGAGFDLNVTNKRIAVFEDGWRTDLFRLTLSIYSGVKFGFKFETGSGLSDTGYWPDVGDITYNVWHKIDVYYDITNGKFNIRFNDIKYEFAGSPYPIWRTDADKTTTHTRGMQYWRFGLIEDDKDTDAVIYYDAIQVNKLDYAPAWTYSSSSSSSSSYSSSSSSSMGSFSSSSSSWSSHSISSSSSSWSSFSSSSSSESTVPMAWQEGFETINYSGTGWTEDNPTRVDPDCTTYVKRGTQSLEIESGPATGYDARAKKDIGIGNELDATYTRFFMLHGPNSYMEGGGGNHKRVFKFYDTNNVAIIRGGYYFQESVPEPIIKFFINFKSSASGTWSTAYESSFVGNVALEEWYCFEIEYVRNHATNIGSAHIIVKNQNGLEVWNQQHDLEAGFAQVRYWEFGPSVDTDEDEFEVYFDDIAVSEIDWIGCSYETSHSLSSSSSSSSSFSSQSISSSSSSWSSAACNMHRYILDPISTLYTPNVDTPSTIGVVAWDCYGAPTPDAALQRTTDDSTYIMTRKWDSWPAILNFESPTTPEGNPLCLRLWFKGRNNTEVGQERKRQIRPLLKFNNVEYGRGADLRIGGDSNTCRVEFSDEFEYFYAEWQFNPETDARWVWSDFDDMAAGFRTYPAAAGGTISQIWLEIVAGCDVDTPYLTHAPCFGGLITNGASSASMCVMLRTSDAATVKLRYSSVSEIYVIDNINPGSDPDVNTVTTTIGTTTSVSDYCITGELTGLTADTLYYFDIIINGWDIQRFESYGYPWNRDQVSPHPYWTELPKCKTFPLESNEDAFTFICAGDQHSDKPMQHQIYNNMGDTTNASGEACRFFIHFGDEHAENTDDLDQLRRAYQCRRGYEFAGSRYGYEVLRKMPIYRIWSDHDAWEEDCWKAGKGKGTTSKEWMRSYNNLQTFLEYTPLLSTDLESPINFTFNCTNASASDTIADYASGFPISGDDSIHPGMVIHNLSKTTGSSSVTGDTVCGIIETVTSTRITISDSLRRVSSIGTITQFENGDSCLIQRRGIWYSWKYGSLAEFFVIDVRSKSDPPKTSHCDLLDGRSWGAGINTDNTSDHSDNWHIQRDWLVDSIRNSTAQWKFIICEQPIKCDEIKGGRIWEGTPVVYTGTVTNILTGMLVDTNADFTDSGKGDQIEIGDTVENTTTAATATVTFIGSASSGQLGVSNHIFTVVGNGYEVTGRNYPKSKEGIMDNDKWAECDTRGATNYNVLPYDDPTYQTARQALITRLDGTDGNDAIPNIIWLSADRHFCALDDATYNINDPWPQANFAPLFCGFDNGAGIPVGGWLSWVKSDSPGSDSTNSTYTNWRIYNSVTEEWEYADYCWDEVQSYNRVVEGATSSNWNGIGTYGGGFGKISVSLDSVVLSIIAPHGTIRDNSDLRTIWDVSENLPIDSIPEFEWYTRFGSRPLIGAKGELTMTIPWTPVSISSSSSSSSSFSSSSSSSSSSLSSSSSSSSSFSSSSISSSSSSWSSHSISSSSSSFSSSSSSSSSSLSSSSSSSSSFSSSSISSSSSSWSSNSYQWIIKINDVENPQYVEDIIYNAIAKVTDTNVKL